MAHSTTSHIAFCSLISLDHHWEANAQGELSWVVVGILVWQCPQMILETCHGVGHAWQYDPFSSVVLVDYSGW